MATCPRCGSPESMALGVFCPECISSEETRQNAEVASASHQQAMKPYGWGKFQGVSLIFGSVIELSHEPSAQIDSAAFSLSALSIALGICILRRNRLVLPLMGLAMILVILTVIAAFLTQLAADLTYASVVGFVIWAISCVYYYNRRSEFKRWL